MSFSISRSSFFICMVLLLALATRTCAFAPVNTPSPKVATSVQLDAFFDSSSDNGMKSRRPSRRREIFRFIRRIAMLGAGGSAIQPLVANAEDSNTEGGRIVALEFANLEGDPDKTGIVKIQLEPSWAPRGVRRFEDLTSIGFWKDCRIFRVLPGFVAQFGIAGNPSLQTEWRSKSLQDDPVRVSNTRGTIVFATAGPNTRTTQIFINTADNAFLDKQGFSPIGRVVEGMEYVDKFYAGYGEGAPRGRGPNQGLIQAKGNAYLTEAFPKLSYISSANFME